MEDKSKHDGTGTFGCTLVFVGIALVVFGKLFGIAAIAAGALLFWYSMRAANADYDKRIEERQREKQERAKRPAISIEVTTSHDDDGGDESEEPESDLTFPIKGINYRDIDETYLGDFVGTARALRSNNHDPYAVGIYIGSRRVGFIPRGNADVHALIMRNGGIIDASGYIARRFDETDGHYFYYGKVTLHPLMS